jgi:putative membrane protein insertion efficiency factor
MPTAADPGAPGNARRRLLPIVLAALFGFAVGDALRPPEDQAGARVALAVIAGYRSGVSPVLQKTHLVRCRFHPTCSGYGREAIQRFGWVKGGALTAARILRCQPFAKGGEDPVPER